MKIVEKYLEAIKTFTDYVTISEWAIKFSEMYPDELQKANEQASNQKNDTTGLREIAARISSNISSGKWAKELSIDDSERPRKVKFISKEELEEQTDKEIEEDIDLNATQDAWTTFFNRKNQAGQFRTDAANYRLQAHQATVSGVLNTASTALSAFGNAPKGGGKTTTQSASNINSNQLTMDTTRLSSSGWA